MAILDVGMLSGFGFPAVAGAPSELIRRVEMRDERVVFYLDSVSISSNIGPRWRRIVSKGEKEYITVFLILR